MWVRSEECVYSEVEVKIKLDLESIGCRLILVLPIIIVITSMVVVFIRSKSCECIKYETSSVIKLGACDRKGYCGVLFKNGSSDVVRYPILGELRKVCVLRGEDDN